MQETGDSYRDTLALTVRGDGVDIPPFFILHTYKNAAKSSGRRCASHETPVKGMNNERMMVYVDHLVQFVTEQSLLLMDRLSSHTSAQVLNYIRSKKTATGEQLLIPILIPAKTAFLISPLDMGAIAAFKTKYYTYNRSTLVDKKLAVTSAWDQVSNEALLNICYNCGIVGEEDISSLRRRFLKEVTGLVPAELEDFRDFYDSWKSATIEVDGATRGRGIVLERPQQLIDNHLDGIYWSKYGGKR